MVILRTLLTRLVERAAIPKGYLHKGLEHNNSEETSEEE